MTKERLRDLLETNVHELFAIEIDEASPQELFQALANVVKQMYSEDWRQTRKISCWRIRNKRIIFQSNFYPAKC